MVSGVCVFVCVAGVFYVCEWYVGLEESRGLRITVSQDTPWWKIGRCSVPTPYFLCLEICLTYFLLIMPKLYHSDVTSSPTHLLSVIHIYIHSFIQSICSEWLRYTIIQPMWGVRERIIMQTKPSDPGTYICVAGGGARQALHYQ